MIHIINKLNFTIIFLIFFCSINAQETGTLLDERNGQVYKTVKIGNQWWMAENLNYGFEDNGEEKEDIYELQKKGIFLRYHYECYIDDIEYCQKYGMLYLYYVADSVCPVEWHLPSDEEWSTLENYLGGRKIAGKKLKSTNGWENCFGSRGINGDNSSGFNALAAAYYDDFNYSPQGDGESAIFWTSSDAEIPEYAWSRWLNCYDNEVFRTYSFYDHFYSIRCVKND